MHFVIQSRLDNNQPVLVQFKQKDGSTEPLLFIEGASVANGASIGILSDEAVVYQGHWSIGVAGEPFGALTDCRIEVYQWNKQNKIFEYSAELSQAKRQDFCLDVENKFLPQ